MGIVQMGKGSIQLVMMMINLLWFSLSLSFYFTFQSSFHSIPFGLYSLSIPMSLLHEALLVSLIYDSQALRLTSSSIPTLPYTAWHCLMTCTDSLSPRGCASPLFPFHLTSYDSTLILLGDTPRNCLSQTTILRHTLRPSHVPLHHPTPPTLSTHLIFPHTVGNSVPVERSYLCDSLWLSLWLSPSRT